MKATMSRENLDYLYKQVVGTFPEEGCGLLAGYGDDERIILGTHQLENGLADERYRKYLIPPTDYRRAAQTFSSEGLEIVGVYHSHPDGSTAPSGEDLRAAWPWLMYLIIGVKDGKVLGYAAWVLRNDRSGFDPVEHLVGA